MARAGWDIFLTKWGIDLDKNRLGFVRFFNGYFKSLHKLILVNLLFAVPAAVFITAVTLINSATGLNNGFLGLLPIVLCFPFLSGVVTVTRNLARGDEDVRVCSQYFKALRENFLRFLIHGVVYYLAYFFCYSSIALYWRLGEQNAFFYIPLGLVIMIAIAALFTAYNVPTMTVTFDLSLRNIYKNSALMSFGEIKNNFFVTIGLFLTFLMTATFYIVIPDLLVRNIVVLAFIAVFVPSTVFFVINFYCFKDMATMISSTGAEDAGIRDENKKPEDDEPLDFSALDLDERKDDDEYLFFNGKMMKRKTLRKMKEEQEKKEP